MDALLSTYYPKNKLKLENKITQIFITYGKMKAN